jgi:hypothetical protein
MGTAFKSFLVFFLSVVIAAGAAGASVAQASNSVGGNANGAAVNVSATVVGIGADVQVPTVAPVSLPPQGGSFTNQVASVNIGISPGVLPVLATSLIVNSTSGSITSAAAHSESTSTVNNLNLLNGLITATTINSKSTSDGNGTVASSSGAGSFVNQLRIAGILYEQSEFAPNTVVSITATVLASINGLPVLVPLTGTVTVNEQIGSGNGHATSSMIVNFLHLNVSGSVAGLITLNANVVVASATSGVDFTAAAGNNPPSLNVPGAQSVQAGSVLNFTVSGSDPDAGDTLTLSASNVPTNATFSQTSGNPATGQFSFNPSQAQSGQTFTVNFTATDNHGASNSRSVQITVTSGPPPANRPPSLNLPGTQTVQVGTNLSFTASGSDPDNGDVVTLSASNLPASAGVTPNPATGNPASSQFSFTPTANQAGQTFTVNYNATDSHGASTVGSVQINVTSGPPPANNPPSLSLPGPQTVAAGTTLTFTSSASDPDNGDIVTLSATNLPAGSSVTPNPAIGHPANSQFSFTPVSSQAGQTFVVNYTATDSHGATTQGSVSITVTIGENHPPIISVPGPQVIGVGSLLTFTVTAVDPDGDGVTISGSSVPVNATFNPQTGGFAFNPISSQAGQIFVVTFTATDSRGGSSSGTVQITVTSSSGGGTPPPPIISLPPSPMILPVGQIITFTVIGTSPVPGCVVSVSSSGRPDHSQFDAASGRFDFTPAVEQRDKSFVITFTATDCNGQTASSTVTVMVVAGLGGALGPGRICVPITKLTFGTTPANGGCGFIIISLTNSGEGNLTINSMKFDDGRNFRAEGISNMPVVLKSAAVIELKIMFQPKDTGPILDVLTIQTTDPENPALTISLKGKGAKQ